MKTLHLNLRLMVGATGLIITCVFAGIGVHEIQSAHAVVNATNNSITQQLYVAGYGKGNK